MPIFATDLTRLSCSSAVPLEDVFFVGNKAQVFWVATKPIVAYVVKNRNVFSLSTRNWSYHPGIHKPMNAIANFIDPDATIPRAGGSPRPNPATRFFVFAYFCKYTLGAFWRHVVNYKHFVHTHIIPSFSFWLNDKWEKAEYPLSWLIDKFAPVPGWE